jgi:hypothetical protein
MRHRSVLILSDTDIPEFAIEDLYTTMDIFNFPNQQSHYHNIWNWNVLRNGVGSSKYLDILFTKSSRYALIYDIIKS